MNRPEAMSLLMALLGAGSVGLAQNSLCNSPVMTDAIVVRQWTKSTVQFGQCGTMECDGPDLFMNVYVPTVMAGGVAMPERFPLMLLIHGGGFTTGNYEMFQWPEAFVKRGMIVASVDYRVGWDVDGDGQITEGETLSDAPDPCGGDYSSLLRAVIRAAMDADAAMRFLLADSVAYPIDKEALFCGGPSAGGALSVHLGYSRPGELQAYWLDLFAGGPPLVQDSCDMRYAPISCPPPAGSPSQYGGAYAFRGVMNCWGALSGEVLMDPHEGTDTGDTIPDETALITFYGGLDHVYPPYIGPPYECAGYPQGYGSVKMFELRREHGYPAQLYTDPDSRHRYVWLDPTLSPGHEASVNRRRRTEFIADRTCCFFKSVLCGMPCNFDEPMVMYDIADWQTAYEQMFGGENGEPIGCNKDGTTRFMPVVGQGEVSVYPNPSNGRVRLLGADFTDGLVYSVYDAIGRQVAQGRLKKATAPIDLRQLPDAGYVIRLVGTGHTYTVRVQLCRWADH